MAERTIREILTETKILYKIHVPQILEQKLPVRPLSRGELKKWEGEIGASMPKDFFSYLSLCNFFVQFEAGFSSLSGEEAKANWTEMNRRLTNGDFDGLAEVNEIELNNYGIQERMMIKAWWSPMWLPFARDEHGNLKCVDLNPQRQGSLGQVLEMNINDGIGPYVTEFDSFSRYLNSQLECLLEERYLVVNGELSLDDGF